MTEAAGGGTLPGQRSPDGRYWWDGQAWRGLSPDGRYFWDGQSWRDAGGQPNYGTAPPPQGSPPAPAAPSAAGWEDRLARHVGVKGPQSEAGAAAAAAAAAAGSSDESALRAGREAAGIYPRPGTEFVRDPRRIALLLFFCGGGLYALWWLWTTFALGIRERFAGSRNFPWILVPIYNLVLVHRNARNLRDAETHYAGDSRLKPGLIMALVLLSWVLSLVLQLASRNTSGILALAFIFAGNAGLAVAGYLNQTSVNRYLKARYPEAQARTSAGEIVTAVVGLLGLVLVVTGSFASR